MENMQTICDALLTTLQLTRRYEDIQSSVECDSGIAMIQDILKNI